MRSRPLIVGVLVLLSAGTAVRAQGVPAPAQAAPVGVADPLPRIDAGGPTAAVTALAFGPDGRALYAAGYDKVVRVWRPGPDGKGFQPDARSTFRVPIGPGRDGVINVLAVSPDGAWLAVSGLGVYRGGSGFGQAGWVVPDDALTAEMRQERSLIYLFNTQLRTVALLRGHEEDVLALAFAPPRPGQPQLLVSVGRRGGDRPGTSTGRICVWDVGRAAALNDKGELVDRGAKLHDWPVTDIAPVPGEPPPGLTVRLTPEGHYRVATAWGDGKLRVCEFGPDGATQPVSADEPRNADGRPAEFTQAVAAAPGRLLTGGFARGKGYVQAWEDAAGQPPRPATFLPLPPPPGVSYTLPRALALVSSGGGRGLDHIAVVLRSPARQGAGFEYRLALLDLNTLRPVQRPDDDALLGTWARPPVMAASPDGQTLAITADQNREVCVYAAADLFGRRPQPVRLRGAGAGAAAVAFARKGQGNDLGLVLRPAGGPVSALAPTDLVLDAGQRSLTPDPGRQGWRLVSPAGDGWRVDRDAAAPNVFHWAGPQGRGTARLRLEPSQVVTAYAIVPPRRPVTEPVLAVASWDTKVGESLLGVYGAATGKPLRRLNAHVQPIRSLAATPDGRMLASAADDQTVCVWGLTDLADVLGRHATLPGVTFRPADGSPVVSRVEAWSPAAGTLAEGDAIESIAGGPGQPARPVGSPLEFFTAAWDKRPGETLRLNVRRNGAARVVAVTLDQGTDERKPLASVFVTGDRAPEWIAWTPLGPYDVGGHEAERYLGWHFNPARPGEPVRFAAAAAYRERMNKPGLLKAILDHANLTDALRALEKPVSLPRATILTAVDVADPVRLAVGGAEQILVRQPHVTLRLRVQGPSLSKGEVESVTWRVNDGPAQPIPLAGATDDTLTQALDLGARGVYRVQIDLRTREAEPQEVTRDLVLRYQPPAPVVRFENVPQSRLTVREAQFRLKAAVTQGAAGQKVAVSFRKDRGEPQAKGLGVDETLTLVPGENVLELRAANEGALAGYEEFETDRRAVVVVFQPKEAPELVVSSLVPVAPPGAAVDVPAGRPVTVASRKARVRGRIAATEPLTVARLGDRPLTGFRPNAVKELVIDEEVALKPDDQEFIFRAKTANSVEAEARLTVVHRPPLPVLTLTEPDPDRSLTEGKDAREVELRGALTPPDGLAAADLLPYQAVLRVTNNGKPVPQADGQAEVIVPSEGLRPLGVLAAKLRLGPGDNRIDVTVRNRWQKAAAVERHVFYRRPPRLTGPLKASPPGEKPFTDVAADVESATELTRVECNGREYPVGQVARRVGESAWRVSVPQVALVPGPNAVRLVVSNRDGPALNEGRADVVFTPPKPKPSPRVELVNKPQGAVKEPQFTARFSVRSAGSRVQRVELRQDSRVLAAVADPRQEPDGPDGFTATGEFGPVALQEGPNRLRLVAVNGGGEAEESFTVSHLPVPEWLEIDEPKSPLSVGEFTLTGRVSWTGADRAAEVERKVRGLRVYVNSAFQQQSPQFRPAGGNRLEFAVKVVLTQRECNLVEVVCPDLRPEAGGRQRFTVDCDRPLDEPRTLHLLVVDITRVRTDATDKALALRALKALQARGAGAQGLRSTVFRQVLMHPYMKDQPTQVVSGYVTCEHVRDALESIRGHSKPNDVALIYWRGAEAVNESGELYLLTSESRPGRKLAHSAIALKEILDFPRDVPGACVLLLDTTSGPPAPDKPAPVPLPSTRVAVLRYAWSGTGTPVPGLLEALEESSATRQATSLKDLAAIADRSRRTPAGSPTVEDNLKELPALADLVISRRPEK